MTVGRAAADGFTPSAAQHRPVAGRCWAAPAVVGDTLIVRSDTTVARVRLAALTADFAPPPDAGKSALDKAFGG